MILMENRFRMTKLKPGDEVEFDYEKIPIVIVLRRKIKKPKNKHEWITIGLIQIINVRPQKISPKVFESFTLLLAASSGYGLKQIKTKGKKRQYRFLDIRNERKELQKALSKKPNVGILPMYKLVII